MRNDGFGGARRGNEAVFRGTAVLRVVLMSPSRTRRGQVVTISDLEELENATQRVRNSARRGAGRGICKGCSAAVRVRPKKSNFSTARKALVV